ncbi:MAG: bifunctional PIG-L family deacetylase/class I SAM-dependent methyltransferase [Fulvimarina manganoxydans]|uniref:bifunctional PIG-L family deacetylase/class I SAM-dependent methyltransferase n=1 Tax=Fulvimarina manganoxydans TaxID=937218 RepID=UPI0023530E6E|nr:bifunctional PIG-L family deacetylase/class I SAM-dependent methyltransferase [Fulvimarina manganoxydans]MCK5930942.1 bifunctional PIG-L family deacetylase/class I SAM-dependent methyltransferase [Fulvimarina manganoxydans]
MSETYGDWMRRCATAPVAEAGRLLGSGGLVVLAPHPDDETFGAAALLCEVARSGRPLGIVALTDGNASHPHSKAVSPAALAEIRQAEQEAAIAAFGIEHPHWLRLGLPDGGAGRDRRFGDAAEQVARFCDAVGAETLAAPHPDDPHPDHHAAAALAEAVRALRPALRLLFYPVWSMRLTGDDPYLGADLLPFRIAVDRETKVRAIECHASQLGRLIEDDPDGFVLPGWFLTAQDAPYEIYALAPMPGEVPPASHFAELYANDGDPWHARSSAYEIDKRADNCDQLKGLTFEAGLDIGCGEGHLTRALVEKPSVRTMLGIDRNKGIVERARRAHAGIPALRFETYALPTELPEGRFDLVVISELLYFLDELALATLARLLADRMTPGASLLLVNYLGETGTPLSGRAAHDLLVALFGSTLRSISLRETEDYRAELLQFYPEGEAGPEGSAPSH